MNSYMVLTAHLILAIPKLKNKLENKSGKKVNKNWIKMFMLVFEI